MSLPLDTPQGIADALEYLQHHLHELTERQNISENNINTTLAALTAQLVANPSSLPIPNTPPPPVLSPQPKLFCSLDFSREHHNSHVFLNPYSLYICLALEQFYNKEERILWALMFFKSGHAAKWSESVFH